MPIFSKVKYTFPNLEPLQDALTHAARAQFALELEQELIPVIIAATNEAPRPLGETEGVVSSNTATAKAAAEVRRILRTHAVRSACIAGEAADVIRRGMK